LQIDIQLKYKASSLNKVYKKSEKCQKSTYCSEEELNPYAVSEVSM